MFVLTRGKELDVVTAGDRPDLHEGQELIGLNTGLDILYTIALIGVSMLIFNNARSAARLRRRAMTPLALVFVVRLIEWVIALLLVISYPETKDALRVADGVLLLAVPVAIIVGQVRG